MEPTRAPNYFEYVGATLAAWIMDRREQFEQRGATAKSRTSAGNRLTGAT
jgi:hypothetical protein